MFKLLLVVLVAVIVGFNGFLAYTNEGLNFHSTREASGDKTVCKYYTPFRLFDIQIDAGRTCPSRVLVR